MVHPFKQGMLENACPMADVFSTLSEQIAELKMLKENANFDMAPS
jgi:adenylate cyclase